MKRYITKDHIKVKIRELALRNGRVEELDEIKQRWQEQELKFMEYLNQGEYNGVTGCLPAWVPKPIVDRFIEARKTIFDNTTDIVNNPHEPQTIIDILDALSTRRGIFANGMRMYPTPLDNSENFDRDIDYLIWVWQTINRGKKAALQIMAGAEAGRALELLENKTASLTKSNLIIKQKTDKRNSIIKLKAAEIKIKNPGIKNYEIANKLKKYHPSCVHKEDGSFLSVDAIVRIINK